MRCMWSKVGMGGEHHRYYKHNKFRQNPRGDPTFLVDLTQNDPYVSYRDFCIVCKKRKKMKKFS